MHMCKMTAQKSCIWKLEASENGKKCYTEVVLTGLGTNFETMGYAKLQYNPGEKSLFLMYKWYTLAPIFFRLLDK